MYPQLARSYDAILYPFFLDGIAGQREHNQADGIHPTSKGVDLIVKAILPKVEELVARVRRFAELAVRANRMSLEETRSMLRMYEEGLAGYTYLERA